MNVEAESSLEVGRLILGAPQWLLPASLLAAAVLAVVIWNYVRGRSIGAVGWFAGGLKFAAVGLIAFCLLEPMRSGERPRPQANVMPILVDNSQSMRLAPEPGGLTRGEQVRRAVGAESSWRTRLDQDFDVRQYAFDSRLRAVDGYDGLTFDGSGSSLVGSLRSLAERLADRPVGGVLLFTDGNLTDQREGDPDWSELGFPVYPVMVGDDAKLRDLRIGEVSIRQTDFESAPLTVTATLDATGLAGEKVTVQLHDLASDRMIEEQTVTLQAGSAGEGDVAAPLRFRFRPEKPGIGFFSVAAFLERERAGFGEGKTQVEATLANNSRLLAVERASGPYRVLYVAGRPNWEFKFLRRSLQEDAEVQLVGLLRIAKEEPKFSFRDRGVSSTNPLFAGLGEGDEEAAERYDEPVILRLGVRESKELSEGFPRSAEELFGYHGVILDDLEPEFFTQDQMLLLRRFVAARGGGLLMLGGEESFAGKRFGDTPLGELSPMYAPRSIEAHPSGQYRLELTREGMLQPWMRLRETESAERERLKAMPAFASLNALGELKPGASLLATVRGTDGRELVALATQRFGRGRTAAVPVTDLWRWAMRREADPSQASADGGPSRFPGGARSSSGFVGSANSEYHVARQDPFQAWRQLVHWLVNEVPRRAEVRVDAPADPGQPVKIIATARDEAYLPLDNAQVQFQITPLGGEPFELLGQPEGDQPGVYAASYWSREIGCYRVDATIKGADGSEIGVATSGWASDPGAAEFHQLRLNRERLASMAEQSGGEVIDAASLDAFVDDLPNRKVPVTETWVFPIWHRPWMMLAAMLCLCGEWGLRRWRGLP